ncbi:MAG: hypothetical protein LC798_12900 [Chloroflexi bacterium]|nr:hypothetical protein [Chloroflexota bacterium]
MAAKTDKTQEAKLGQAEAPDYDFLDKPLDGYPPGTVFDFGNGEKLKIDDVPKVFGASAPDSSK